MGSATVIRPGREHKELGRNKLDGGTESKQTPAFAGSRSSSARSRICIELEQK
jgi:hypothetical protein